MPRFKIEQIALMPVNQARAIELLHDLGMTDWIFDTVSSRGDIRGELDRNVAQLAFNYDSEKPPEFELLSYAEGGHWLASAMRLNGPSIASHLGMHVTWHEWLEFDEVFRKHQISVAQDINTCHHENRAIRGNRFYRYIIYDTRSILGIDLKFIIRLNAEQRYGEAAAEKAAKD